MSAIDIIDTAKASRIETHTLLATAEHYMRLARGHLELADDSMALMDLLSAREHFVLALAAFRPVRAAMVERGKVAA